MFAQSERGTITGVIHDSSGAIVPGAKISIENQATKVTLTAVSNETGEYTVPSLSPGTYRVRVNKDGFRAFEVAGLTLDASQTVRADANLEVGTANQTVEVMASAIQVQSEDRGRPLESRPARPPSARSHSACRSSWRFPPDC
jgi:hypothetical protein